MFTRRSVVPAAAALLLLTSLVMAQAPAGPSPTAGGSSAEADQFYDAIRADNLGRLETLLKSGADPNVRDTRGGATPLMYAAGIGSVDAMKVLLDHKADVNRANSSGATALMWAGGNLDKVRLLLSRGANAKAASQRGRTALYIAAKHSGAAPVVKLLLEAGADPKATDEMKATPLLAAVAANDIDTSGCSSRPAPT
jgi:ankyrin repeat protein